MNIPILASTRTLNAALETWFIQNILFNGNPFSPGGYPSEPFDNVAIYVELYEIDTSIIRRLKTLGKKVVLYHMGDEIADKKIFAYQQCDLVIRNYYFPSIMNLSVKGNILWAPNGFRTGVGPRATQTIKSSSTRNHLSSFLGWLSNSASYKHERSKFAKIAPACKPLLNLLESGGFSNGYNVGLYSAIMEDTVYAPCPAGNSPETIRLYDALECGCIPVSLKHDFISAPQALSAIGAPPFVMLDSWQDLPQFLKEQKGLYTNNPDKINALQKECTQWWSNYKRFISDSISEKIKVLLS